MKKSTNAKSVAAGGACCSRRQKIYGVIALGGLFACGLMVGIAINGGNNSTKKELSMSFEQCNSIASEIVQTRDCWNMSTNDCIAKLNTLNEVYVKNCAGRTFDVEEPKIQQASEDMADKETCEVIENMKLSFLYPEMAEDPNSHNSNIAIYNSLIKYGCPENVEKYQALIQREQDILEALTGKATTENTQTCDEIESLLIQRLPVYNLDQSNIRIERAKIYANLSERGCPENSQRYVDLASKELEVARALEDDRFNEYETEEVVETYKRLEMKQAASEVLNKVQKLTDPAIDFILKMEQIINE